MPRLHVLANPYGITDRQYQMDPFGVAISKFIENMTAKGYDLLHYGHEFSRVKCDNVTVITEKELAVPDSYSEIFSANNKLLEVYNSRVKALLHKTAAAGDIVLCWFGVEHQPAVESHRDLIIAEPNIGYRTSCVFAPYRAFTSYAQMHYYYGNHGMMHNPSWYDAVIPNAITPDEFEFTADKDDYLLYLGRLTEDKGIPLAIQIAEYTNKPLIIAGPGDLKNLGYAKLPRNVELVGYADLEKRKQLMSRAKALLAPTYYIEPFGNVVAEAQMSGTPVITTDWGGFVDNVSQGVTGFRCKDFRSFVAAVNSLDSIASEDCRSWAESNFSDEVVHELYHRWFTKIIENDFYRI